MAGDKIANIFTLYLLVDLILPLRTKSPPRTVSFHEGRQLQKAHFCLHKNRSTFEPLSSTLIKREVLLCPLKAFCSELKSARFSDPTETGLVADVSNGNLI